MQTRYTEVFTRLIYNYIIHTQESTTERTIVNGRYAAPGAEGLQSGRRHRSYVAIRV